MANRNGKTSVLVVDDEELLRWALVTQLTRSGFSCHGCESAEDALEQMAKEPARLVLLDIRLPGMDGMECLKILREKYADTAVIMMTGHGAIDSAVEAMMAGAYNYLTKPFDYRSVLAMAESLLSEAPTVAAARPPASTRRRPAPAAGTRPSFGVDDLIGSSPAMERIRAILMKVAKSSATTVLLTGESGTGKDLAAQIIHYSSARSSNPFVHVNVASVPAALFESELFGHEKGSYTDAHSRKQGLLELANGGTIYLDEVGELSPEVQTKLLHFLEHRSFRRLGAVDSLQVDVRVVAATNVNLKRKIAQAEFREDLFFRLNVIPVRMPPLSQRAGDAEELAVHFLRLFNRSHGKDFNGFDDAALEKIRSNVWTGNVRELRNAIERAVTLEDGERVTPGMLDFGEEAPGLPEVDSGMLGPVPGGLRELEKRMLVSALEDTEWNQVKAAEILGIGRDALRYRMRKHGLL